jgi:hypothetical protein
VSKETYTSVKRDLHQRQKRPTLVSKETYTSVKRDLHQRQKRPTLMSKETYTELFYAKLPSRLLGFEASSDKRDLH